MASAATSNDEHPGNGLGTVLRVRVELWLVVVMMALAFGAGILVTALYEEPQAVVGVQQPTGQFSVAPPLTDDQISQGLPSGHPDISGETGATGGGKGDADAGADAGSAQGDGASGGSK